MHSEQGGLTIVENMYYCNGNTMPVLTRKELFLVLFIMTALVVGAAVKHWRESNSSQSIEAMLPASDE